MLSKQDKQRITEEEMFRSKVQKSMAAAESSPKSPQKWWDFLNSHLGIWFLSTIVVTFVGWNYARWQSSQANIEQIDKIDDEIEARLDSTVYYDPIQPESPFYLANYLLLAPEQQRMFQPEFANRNLKSLFIELKSRVPPREWTDRQDILEAQSQIRYIESRYLNRELNGEERSDFINRLHIIRNGRYMPSKMMERYSRYHGVSSYELAFLGVWLVLFSILLLYGVYLLFRWIYRLSWKAFRLRKERNQLRSPVRRAQPDSK